MGPCGLEMDLAALIVLKSAAAKVETSGPMTRNCPHKFTQNVKLSMTLGADVELLLDCQQSDESGKRTTSKESPGVNKSKDRGCAVI